MVILDGGADGGVVEGCYDRESRVINNQERDRSNTLHLLSLPPPVDVMHIRIPIS